MTNPELAPDMPEEISVKKEMMTRGHYNYDVIGHGNIAGYTTYRRADLAPQAGSVDVEGLRHRYYSIRTDTIKETIDLILTDLASRNLLNPGPQGWRDTELLEALKVLGPFSVVQGDTITRLQPGSNVQLNMSATWAVSSEARSGHKIRTAVEKINAILAPKETQGSE